MVVYDCKTPQALDQYKQLANASSARQAIQGVGHFKVQASFYNFTTMQVSLLHPSPCALPQWEEEPSSLVLFQPFFHWQPLSSPFIIISQTDKWEEHIFHKQATPTICR